MLIEMTRFCHGQKERTEALATMGPSEVSEN
jgi:hypothetical protein